MSSSSWIFHSSSTAARLFRRNPFFILHHSQQSLPISPTTTSTSSNSNMDFTTPTAAAAAAAVSSTSKEPRRNQQQQDVVTTQQIPCPLTENDKDDFSLHHLQQRSQWLIENHSALGKVCLAIAGGGGHALSTLAATSGASQLLLEGTVTYDRSSFQTFVGKALPNDKHSSFSYSSSEAAKMASERALLQGMQLQSRNSCCATDTSSTAIGGRLAALRNTVGLGSASTLKTTTKGGMSKSGKPSHGNVVATRAIGNQQVCMNIILNCPTQNRFQQDVFVSHMILQTLEELAKIPTVSSSSATTTTANATSANANSNNNNNIVDSTTMMDPKEFEGVTIQQWRTKAEVHVADHNGDHGNSADEEDDPVQSAARRILSGDAQAVLLLPKPAAAAATTTGGASAFSSSCHFLEPLLYPVLPDNCLVFPGSFNPPHVGHVELAKAAMSKLSSPLPQNIKNTNGLANAEVVQRRQEQQQRQRRPLVFEISITNADKPAMDPREVSRRVSQFRELLLYGNDNNNVQEGDEGTPFEWGILLTSAPLFADKVRVLKQYAPPPLEPDSRFPITTTDDDNDNDNESNNRKNRNSRWAFVIGTDTMVRILNPKYYNHDYEQMLQAQRSMGVDFVVGGRLLDPTTTSAGAGTDAANNNRQQIFVTGKEALEGLPLDVQDMFILLEESDFRVDISSTELRAQKQQEQHQL